MLSQAANRLEQTLGHDSNATTAQDITQPRGKYAAADGSTMKALTWQGKNTVRLMEVPKPAVVEPRDVLVRVTGSTVCGSDLHLLHGTVVQLSKGDILGHEFCGVVEALGPEAERTGKLKVGDRVVASFQVACGDCFFCKQRLSSQCERTNANTMAQGMYGGRTAGMLGYSHFTGGFAGGQAEYVRIPFGDVNLLKLPDDVPEEKGLYLSDILCTAYNCVVDTGVSKDDIVAIWGGGAIGQMAVTFSFMVGAKRVILIDPLQWRLEHVKKHNPGVETINPAELKKNGSSVYKKLQEMTDDRGPDDALECVGGEYAMGLAHKAEITLGAETDTSEIINEMIESVRNYGRCGITGVYVGFTNHFNVGSLMQRGIRLIGNGQAPVHLYWEKICGMIQRGEVDPLQMVTQRVRLEDIETVYDKFNKREEGIQKVFVQTQFSPPPAPGAPQLTTFDS